MFDQIIRRGAVHTTHRCNHLVVWRHSISHPSQRQSLSTPWPAIMSPLVLLVWSVLSSSTSTSSMSRSLPESFCGSHYPRLGCCEGRRDLCGVNMMNTTCYCDTFCVRSVQSGLCIIAVWMLMTRPSIFLVEARELWLLSWLCPPLCRSTRGGGRWRRRWRRGREVLETRPQGVTYILRRDHGSSCTF